MESGKGHDWSDIGEQIDSDAQSFAKAALGIPEAAEIRPLDVSKAALFVLVERDGMAKVNASIPKREAAGMLRHIADIWDQEWKSEERAHQQHLRGARKSGQEETT